MKKIAFILALCLVAIAGNSQEKNINYNPNAKKDTTKKSIRSAAVGKIGTANVRINYYSPGVRGRIIWGGVVPLDEVWVTGAHSATNIEISKAFRIGKKTIPAGTMLFSLSHQKQHGHLSSTKITASIYPMTMMQKMILSVCK